MDRGYLKLWRKSLDSEVFANESLWILWTWCLMKASHKERFVKFVSGKGDRSVHVLPGQFVFGRNKAAEVFGWSPSTTWNRLQKLAEIGCLAIDSNKQCSVVTICNWAIYQPDETQKVTSNEHAIDMQPTSNDHAIDTNKNVKNVKKKEKSTPVKSPYGTFKNVLLSGEEFQKLSTQFGSNLDDKINNLSEGIESKGYKYNSHYATILNWSRRDKGKDQPVSPQSFNCDLCDYKVNNRAACHKENRTECTAFRSVKP